MFSQFLCTVADNKSIVASSRKDIVFQSEQNMDSHFPSASSRHAATSGPFEGLLPYWWANQLGLVSRVNSFYFECVLELDKYTQGSIAPVVIR